MDNAELAGLILGFAVAWQLLFWLMQAVSWPSPPNAEQGPMCRLKVVNMLHAAVAAPYATWLLVSSDVLRPVVTAMLRMDDEALGKHPGALGAYDDRAAWVVSLTVGFFIFDLVNLRLWESKDPVMILHHVTATTVFPLGLHFRVGCTLLCICISSELSSPFLQGRWIARTFRGKNSAAFKNITLLFGVSFLLVRTWTIPFWDYAIWCMRPWAYNGIPMSARVIATVMMPLPALLNLLWTVQILQTAMRTQPAKRKSDTLLKEEKKH